MSEDYFDNNQEGTKLCDGYYREKSSWPLARTLTPIWQCQRSWSCIQFVPVLHLPWQKNSGQTAGSLTLYFLEWRELISDLQILKTLTGFDFVYRPPLQMPPPKEIAVNVEESQIISSQIISSQVDKLLTKSVMVKSQHCLEEFLSTIKKDAYMSSSFLEHHKVIGLTPVKKT